MRKYKITVNGKSYEVEVEELGVASANVAPAPSSAVSPQTFAPRGDANAQPPEKQAAPASVSTSVPAGAASITAPMPGNIVSVNVKAGDVVAEGTVLCILEAMKMENEIMAPKAGTVASVNVAAGAAVNSGDVLVSIA